MLPFLKARVSKLGLKDQIWAVASLYSYKLRKMFTFVNG